MTKKHTLRITKHPEKRKKIMTQAPDRITLPAAKTATYSIIWLHGLGADGNDFAPVIPL